MLTVRHAGDLAAHAGARLGHSDWITVDQAMVDAFAALSGDDHWIHVDIGRAGREMPGGRTIVHGLLLLSLMPALQRQVYSIDERGIGLNYGYDRVRFLVPVPVGSRVRLALSLVAAETHPQGTRITTDASIELADGDKIALIARHILLVKDQDR